VEIKKKKKKNKTLSNLQIKKKQESNSGGRVQCSGKPVVDYVKKDQETKKSNVILMQGRGGGGRAKEVLLWEEGASADWRE